MSDAVVATFVCVAPLNVAGFPSDVRYPAEPEEYWPVEAASCCAYCENPCALWQRPQFEETPSCIASARSACGLCFHCVPLVWKVSSPWHEAQTSLLYEIRALVPSGCAVVF